jgi:hypothetical protein
VSSKKATTGFPDSCTRRTAAQISRAALTPPPGLSTRNRTTLAFGFWRARSSCSTIRSALADSPVNRPAPPRSAMGPRTRISATCGCSSQRSSLPDASMPSPAVSARQLATSRRLSPTIHQVRRVVLAAGIPPFPSDTPTTSQSLSAWLVSPRRRCRWMIETTSFAISSIDFPVMLTSGQG